MSSAGALAADSAVVLMYHRFGESGLPSTNIRIDQFEAHIAELKNGRYTVIGLADIVAALRNAKPLPERTVGLSVDDAFLSFYQQGWPRLRAAGLPVTLFVATDAVDRNSTGYMTWDQLRELAAAGVTIGSQTAPHPRLAAASRQRIADELARANQRFAAELGKPPTLIAYPYGEYGLTVGDVAREAGFVAGFGQHSGVLYRDFEPFFRPRFAMNEGFGSLGRLRQAATALPLPVTGVTPADPLLGPETNPPLFGFTLAEDIAGLSALACYVSDQGKARIEILGGRRVEVRLSRAFSPGRWRINCTAPEGPGRWRWFGRQFYVVGR